MLPSAEQIALALSEAQQHAAELRIQYDAATDHLAVVRARLDYATGLVEAIQRVGVCLIELGRTDADRYEDVRERREMPL